MLGNNGHMEASSSAIKVDCDGDVVSESGSCKNDASDETPIGFILKNAIFLSVLRCSRHKNPIQNTNMDRKIFSSNFFFSLVWRSKHFQLISISANLQMRCLQTLNDIDNWNLIGLEL